MTAPALLRPRPALLALAAALLVALPGTAAAQRLKELYEAARGYDATYLAARAQAQAAEFRAEQANALRRPTLTGVASGTYGQTRFESLGSRDTRVNQAALNGRYTLYNRSNSVTIEQAARALEAAQADLESAEQDLIVRIATAYFDVLGAQDTLAAVRSNKTQITEQLASAKRNFEVGTATITDTREAQARFDLATAQEVAADNDLRAKRIALDQLVGRTGVVPQPLAVPVGLPPLVPSNVEEWVNTADGVHPAVRKARLGHEIALLETDKARAAEGPTVDATAQVGAQDSRGSAITLPGTAATGTVGVQLNWPIYTGGLTQNRIKETMALEEKAANDLSAARRGVAQSTRVAFFGVQSGQVQVKALEAAESSSRLALEATQLGFKVGVRVNLDVLNATSQLFSTQRDLAKARYDVIVGGLRLRQASGQLVPSDVDLVDSLIAK
jgi:outer membrane protein